jgi:hypothetical protein
MSERAKVTAKTAETKKGNCVSQKRKTGFSRSLNSPVDRILFLQRAIGNQAVQTLIKDVRSPLSVVRGQIQAKLRVSQFGDIYEQEADRVAEQVMRMPEPRLQRQFEPEKEEEEEKESIQAKFADACLVQRQEDPEEEEEEIRPKPLSEQITPPVQRQVPEEEEEEEPVQMKMKAYSYNTSEVTSHLRESTLRVQINCS